MRFTDKVSIVTGGASGIGAATAARLAREGSRVMIGDISTRGQQTAAELADQGLEVCYMPVDVSNEEQVAALVRSTLERWHRLDVMVSNAGISGLGRADTTSRADWDKVIGVNLTSVFLCCKHAVPAMRASGGGAIVNTASIIGLVGHRGALSYAAAKGAVVNMTRAAALDYAGENIRINAVSPGFLNDPTTRMGAARSDAELRLLMEKHPLGRLGACRT